MWNYTFAKYVAFLRNIFIVIFSSIYATKHWPSVDLNQHIWTTWLSILVLIINKHVKTYDAIFAFTVHIPVWPKVSY